MITISKVTTGSSLGALLATPEVRYVFSGVFVVKKEKHIQVVVAIARTYEHVYMYIHIYVCFQSTYIYIYRHIIS